ncbi:MAG: hypothetical protein ABIF85_02415 [Nanoarchaeota archaeon]|nr:hypothetical protein [Nanoarchaeota archaeon]MBU4451635.1 hypothetical protein [Nanoarchaeota archaeon]MCG2724072.1 hypothetical protein [archaeon]
MFIDMASIQYNVLGQFILPFMLFFAIVYGSLRTGNVFKERHINNIIAAVVALMATSSSQLVSMLYEFMPMIITLLVALFVINLFYQLLGKPGAGESKKNTDVIMLIGALLIILAVAGESFMPDTSIMNQTNLIFLFALLGIFIIYKRAG